MKFAAVSRSTLEARPCAAYARARLAREARGPPSATLRPYGDAIEGTHPISRVAGKGKGKGGGGKGGGGDWLGAGGTGRSGGMRWWGLGVWKWPAARMIGRS